MTDLEAQKIEDLLKDIAKEFEVLNSNLEEMEDIIYKGFLNLTRE